VRTAKVERSTRGVEKGLLSPPLVVEVGDEDKGREGVIESEEEDTALPRGGCRATVGGAIRAGLPSRRAGGVRGTRLLTARAMGREQGAHHARSVGTACGREQGCERTGRRLSKVDLNLMHRRWRDEERAKW
jgi:hypothetical protein